MRWSVARSIARAGDSQQDELMVSCFLAVIAQLEAGGESFADGSLRPWGATHFFLATCGGWRHHQERGFLSDCWKARGGIPVGIPASALSARTGFLRSRPYPWQPKLHCPAVTLLRLWVGQRGSLFAVRPIRGVQSRRFTSEGGRARYSGRRTLLARVLLLKYHRRIQGRPYWSR